jgi:uncharacterized membrane protein HdeD (DUF308 family)
MTMLKSYGETASDMPAGQSFAMAVVKEAVELNWPWVMIYGVMTVVGLVAAYGLSGWSSMVTAFLVALVTLYVGYRLAQTAIAIARR